MKTHANHLGIPYTQPYRYIMTYIMVLVAKFTLNFYHGIVWHTFKPLYIPLSLNVYLIIEKSTSAN